MKDECVWLDTKNKHGCKPRGFNIEPFEKLLKKGTYTKRIGVAIEKEYGKRITRNEWTSQHGQPVFVIDAVWQVGLELGRINHRINEQVKQEAKKHLK